MWIHESERIYSDRLVNQADIISYRQISVDILKKSFSKYTSIQKFYAGEKSEPLIFNNFPKGYQGERFYGQVTFEDTEKNVKEALRDYNEQNVEMKLVLFEDAIKHVCRITRIVSESGGHALLVGVGGSGKQSLSKIAAFIAELNVFSITVSSTYSTDNLKSDLIDLYKKTGEKDYGIMFLITDSHITNERFLVYINDLLSSGEIADLYNEEDKLNIINAVRPKVKMEGGDVTPDGVWAWFINRVRKNLHVTLCFSPVGDTFRTRARRFPGLINSTVIDWFHPWPEEALKKVTKMFLDETLTDVDVTDETMRENIVNFMSYSFEIANQASKKIFEVERRHVHNTPKSFLELITLFKNMLLEKRQNLIDEQFKYEMGLSKLNETEETVIKLEAELKIKNVEVSHKKEEANKVAEVVGKEKASVEEENRKASEKEKICSEISVSVQAFKKECEEDVRKLEPMVVESLAKVQNLDTSSITEIRQFKVPPPGVDKVFFCIMYMFSGVPGGFDDNIELNKKKVPKNLTWKGALKLLSDPGKIIKDLMRFPKEIEEDNVPSQNFKGILPYFEDDLFKNPEKMIKKSKMAAIVLEFLISMKEYYEAMR